MFQVATHPTSFPHHHGHSHHHQQQREHQPHSHRQPQSSQSVRSESMPRKLQRPSAVQIHPDAIAAADPDVANVPLEYIQRGLRDQGSQLLSGISAMVGHMPTSIPKSQLPRSLPIPMRVPSSPTSTVFPTHVLAVYASKSSSDAPLATFPVHALVLATHCAKFPRMPSSHQRPGHSLNLPVLPLSLPSPAAFSILHSYMYTHRLDSLLSMLLPLPKSFLTGLDHEGVRHNLASGAKLHQLSSYLCAASNNSLQSIMTHAEHIKELWQDMVSLGMQEADLWDTIDLAYEVVLGALNLVAAQ